MGGNFVMFTAFIIITIWALWCVLSRHVSDGIIGKILYSVISIASFSGAAHQYGGTFAMTPYITMIGALALLAVRHFVINTTNRNKRGH